MGVTKARLALAMLAIMSMPHASNVLAAESSAEAAPSRKAYVNGHYGFRFDFPASWSLIEAKDANSNGALLSLRLLSPDQNIPVMRDYSPGSFSVDVWANPDRRPLREWLDQQGWPFAAADRTVTAGTIQGRPSLDVSTGKMFAPNRFIYVANENWVLRMSALAPDAPSVLQSLRFEP